jgi:hypothetical protein
VSVLDTLITDRTNGDVQDRNDKGTYNATDINRVNEAAKYVAQEALDLLQNLQQYLQTKGVATAPIFQPYEAGDVNIQLPIVSGDRTAWEIPDIPYPSQMTQYLSNISNLRALLLLPSGTPSVPSDMSGLTYQEANAIEQILLSVDTALAAWWANAQQQIDYIGTYANQLVSGTFYAGSNRTLQHFSRGR